MTLVKICGLTRAEDARLAAELGAWALGFVLTESPRRASPAAAARLIAAARDERAGAHSPFAVAVVTTESPAWIAAALAEAGANAVQLSAGADGPGVTQVREAAARLRRRPLVIAAADTPDAGLADFVLLDARTSAAYGGTGETLDWDATAADPVAPATRLVLAGGLHSGNVGATIAALRPAAVDLSSGVESAPGVKDHRRLRDFFTAVEQADSAAAVVAPERTGI